MAGADGTGRAPRSGFVPLCAAILGMLCALWTSGCLNPLPDEQPSSRANDEAPELPIFGEEDLAGSGAAGSGAGPAAPSLNVDEQTTDPSGAADGEPPADAGAPDAGVTSDDNPEGLQ